MNAQPDPTTASTFSPTSDGQEFGRFFRPGPTEVRPEVLEAMNRPVIGHRGPEMKGLIGDLQPGLRALFGTARPVYISTSSATGLMEAAVTNLSRRRVLCLVNGAFGARFHDIAATTGHPADRLEVPWGEPNRPARLRERLAADPDRYDLVTVVHSETSTGVLNPVRELAAVVDEFEGVLLAVDGVSSVAGGEVRFDEWGVDFLLTGSQKALALPPGLSFAAASAAAVERAHEVPARSHYFDLTEFDRRIRNHQTPNTPAVPLLYALERQLERIRQEGVGGRIRRHESMSRRTQEWVSDLADRTGSPYRVLAPEDHRSPTVTAVRLPEGVTGTDAVDALGERGFTISPGYGKLKDASLRIGHMGDHTLSELEELLAALDEVLAGSGA